MQLDMKSSAVLKDLFIVLEKCQPDKIWVEMLLQNLDSAVAVQCRFVHRVYCI